MSRPASTTPCRSSCCRADAADIATTGRRHESQDDCAWLQREFDTPDANNDIGGIFASGGGRGCSYRAPCGSLGTLDGTPVATQAWLPGRCFYSEGRRVACPRPISQDRPKGRSACCDREAATNAACHSEAIDEVLKAAMPAHLSLIPCPWWMSRARARRPRWRDRRASDDRPLPPGTGRLTLEASAVTNRRRTP